MTDRIEQSFATGTAPITLMDGDKLVDGLIEHEAFLATSAMARSGAWSSASCSTGRSCRTAAATRPSSSGGSK